MLGRRSAARTLLAALATFLAVVLFTPAPQADAATIAQQAVTISAAQKGKPYKYGAVGPRAFDCSGLVVYVYNTRLHKKLPRTATAQRKATVRIAKSSIRPGDLVFFAPSATSRVSTSASMPATARSGTRPSREASSSCRRCGRRTGPPAG